MKALPCLLALAGLVAATPQAWAVSPVPADERQEPTASPARGSRPAVLSLTGKATVEAAPDFATISVGITNRAPTTAGAIDGTSTAAARIVAAAKEFGIAPRDIQTDYVSLQPAYRTVRDPSGGTEQKQDGYQASNAVNVRVRDLGRLGDYLRTVVDGGANRIGSVTFGLNDPGKLEREALAAAVRDARAQAETIAGAAGLRLGRIEEIRYGARPDRPMEPRAFAARAAAPPPVPVQAGSLEVAVEVEVVWGLEAP